MKKATLLTSLLAAGSMALASTPQTKIEWTTLGNFTEGAQAGHYIQRFIITGDTGFEKFAFNQFARKMEPLDSNVKLTEIVPGYYEVQFPKIAGKDTVIVDISTRGALTNICYAPDGVHKINDTGKSEPVEYINLGIIDYPEQWSIPTRDRMPDAADTYRFNSRLQEQAKVFASTPEAAYALVPSLKNISLNPKWRVKGSDLTLSTVRSDTTLGDTVKITVKGKTMTALLSPRNVQGMMRVNRLYDNLKKLKSFSGATIVDYPDYSYRGAMIDIARNYQTPSEMKRIIDQMARYGFSVLHFHVADDEAWRLDIPGLPELVKVGGRRGYTTDESEFLAQIFCGDGNPDNTSNTSNGYFTQDDFIDMLRYADSKGITVLPEIESPGHARAAIKAMQYRARTTGDTSFLLSEEGDTSTYTSAQAFHDNVMNPALPGPYRFMRKVIDGIADLYTRAGVNLPAIHIGGDEVPRGAWNGSKATREFMARHNMTEQKQVHAYFVEKINDYLLSKKIPISGWSEISVGHSDEYDKKVAPNTYSVNCWHNFSDKPQSEARQSLRRGYPVVISNVDYFYLDQMYTPHPMERGLNWGGYVDEYRTLSGTRDKFSALQSGDKGRIAGLSGQLFSETVRSAAGIQSLLFPKMTGLAERAWNADSTYTDGAYAYVIASQEIPHWDAADINYHLGAPGILHLEDGRVAMNAPYATVGEIRYTTDGTDPDTNSLLYTGPVTLPSGAKPIRAAYYSNGRRSVTTIDR